MSEKDEKVIGAWQPRADSKTSRTGFQVVYMTKFGTAHAGATRKVYRIPNGVLADIPVVSRIAGTAPTVHPLLRCDDKELAEAFERLVKEPSFSKIRLTPWEFKLAANAPSVFIQYGGFTWKQRKYLREIVKKIVQPR